MIVPTKKYLDVILGDITVGQIMDPDAFAVMYERIIDQLRESFEDGFRWGRGTGQKPIHKIKDGIIIDTYPSVADAARSVDGGDGGTIVKIAKGKSKYKNHKGYTWAYAKERKRGPYKAKGLDTDGSNMVQEPAA